MTAATPIQSDEHIQIEDRGPVRILRFNRADKKNAITHAMYSALVAGLKGASASPDIRCVVLTGSGGVFTSGNDIVDFMQTPVSPGDDSAPVAQYLAAISTFEKPLIAAVPGAAVGIGMTMLLHCDLVYAGASATMSMPFVDLALVPEAASSQIVPRKLGHQRAAQLFMLGEKLDAETARDWGLVNAVLADDAVEAVAIEKARALAAKAPAAVRLTKELMRRPEEPVEARIRHEGGLFAERLKTEEAGEAFTAFMERRAPDFSRFS